MVCRQVLHPDGQVDELPRFTSMLVILQQCQTSIEAAHIPCHDKVWSLRVRGTSLGEEFLGIFALIQN
jgi:hypothetical protein